MFRGRHPIYQVSSVSSQISDHLLICQSVYSPIHSTFTDLRLLAICFMPVLVREAEDNASNATYFPSLVSHCQAKMSWNRKKKMHQCILKLSQMESLENFKRKRERVGQGGVPRAPEGFLYRRPVSELPWDMQPAFFSLPELDIRSRWELQEGLNRMSELEMTLRVIHLGLHFIEGVEVGDSSPQLGSHGPGIYHNLRRSALPSQASWFQGRPFMSFLSCSLAQLQRLKRNYLFCLQIQHWTLGRGDREMVSFVCLCVSVCLSFTNTLRPGQEQP